MLQTPKKTDQYWMHIALELAKSAAYKGEVPVGAIVVEGQKIIASAFNQKESMNDCSAHAEILALKDAAQYKKNWRLDDCTLYTNLEPCIMCAGALSHFRISKCVYGLEDPKFGALGSLYQIHEDTRLNHRFEIESNVLEAESKELMQSFFEQIRSKRKKPKH